MGSSGSGIWGGGSVPSDMAGRLGDLAGESSGNVGVRFSSEEYVSPSAGPSSKYPPFSSSIIAFSAAGVLEDLNRVAISLIVGSRREVTSSADMFSPNVSSVSDNSSYKATGGSMLRLERRVVVSEVELLFGAVAPGPRDQFLTSAIVCVVIAKTDALECVKLRRSSRLNGFCGTLLTGSCGNHMRGKTLVFSMSAIKHPRTSEY